MLSFDEIKELTKLLEDSSLNKIELKYEDGKILLEKAPTQPVQVPNVAAVNPAVQAAPAPQVVEAKPSEQIVEITAPMVGTFYSSQDPKSDPFVKVGSKVTPNTVVCILEAMKLFSEVEAEVEGEITEILAKDGDFVEFGQPLFKVKTKQ